MIASFMGALLARDLGFRLSLSGDGKRIRISPGRVPQYLKETLSAHKGDLLRILEYPRAGAGASWLTIQAEIAKRWELHAVEARKVGRSPVDLDDEDIRARVRKAIEGTTDHESLARALGLVEEWRAAWLGAMGGIPAVDGGEWVEL